VRNTISFVATGIQSIFFFLSLWAVTTNASHHLESLRPTGGLAPHIVGQFRDLSVFQQSSSGEYLVFDRGAQSVYRINNRSESATEIVNIGPEAGHILGASAFDLGPNDRFVVADAPSGRERVQIFDATGKQLDSFRLPGQAAPRVTLGNVVLNGVGSLVFSGNTILMNQPELGGLITKFSLRGQPYHTFGTFRRTGHEIDRDVHLALNSGLPLTSPDGSYYFVFQTGRPMFRKYDASGNLLFERHIEGTETDSLVNSLPTVWPQRTDPDGRTLPVVPPSVRTAAVDQSGNLWVALSVPFLYVYDATGEKIRTIRLQAAGLVSVSSLYFPDEKTMLVAPGGYEFTVW
jgi:hypothetical protein